MRRLGLLASFAIVVGCGGSSSETPPPLEPDPERLRQGLEAVGNGEAASPAAVPSPAGGPANPRGATPPRVIQPLPERRGGPPASTWGGRSPRPRAPELAPEPRL
jgi:hypothetical protein